MASGSGPGGFGRGGRGAALLQALAESARKPGQTEKELSQNTTPQTEPLLGSRVMRSAVASSEPLLPMGRGALLANLRESMLQAKKPEEYSTEQQQEAPVKLESSPQTTPGLFSSSGAGVSELVPKPLGRGSAAMKALLAQEQQQRHLPPSLGRRFDMPIQQHKERPQTDEADLPAQEMAQLRLEDQPVIRERVRFPTVTKIGTEGTPVDLSANYVKVLCKHKGVYQYCVAFSPAIDNRKLKMKLLAEHKERFKTVNSFDGNILYLPFELPDKETVVTSKRITDGATITITVTFIKVVPPEQCCHLYNVVLRRIMYILEMCQVGRYYYNGHTAATVPQHKLEVWPGYVTAIKEHEGGLLLLLDASHKVLRTETVHDIMEKTAITNTQGFQDEIIRRVVGCTVLTRYNNKTYRVDDIVWSKSPMDRFECKATGESMSFEEYYRKQYNIIIHNKTQPLLLNKRKPPKGAPPGTKPDPEFLCLIPELCYMTGLTEDIRKQFTVMKDLAIHTRVTPAQRKLAMKKFISSVNSSPEAQAELAIWGLQLDGSTISIAGRQLPQEKIIMGRKGFPAGPQADWSREIGRNELICPVNLVNWGLFYTRKDSGRANDFARLMLSETRNLGISCQAPFRRELVNEKIDTLVQELRHSINDRVQLVVVINPTNRDDRYSAIKKVCCVESPVPSQVIISKTISKPDKMRSIVQKIALQINCKLGGELWSVKIPLQKLMVVGIDTYHDNARSKQSIGGFVASMNQDCTRWYSNVCFQRPGQELAHGLHICLTNALRKYHSVNHFLPEKIVIYRDGVGDGQLNVLADHEVKQLHRSFSSFGDYSPQCTTVCVQKRINTRIFKKERDGEVGNPLPGTVVDHTVTRRDRYDFFIVSQHVRQGTVSPTHYIVVDDGVGLQPGLMQRLTYKMTHLYYNWPGTVRVPAPCQYAHKLAYLVGESIHKEPAECLSDRLFFL
ncbi:unnamed protein product [Candidula unifasciata]|uniref:Piwi-like protein 2 n=1 Tax=Candidula unifasciata TaxID=100452 RepID=A0A8S3YCW0_9EUPU|nr:unnamed protein product [Candidula unifasciata]